MAIHRKQINQRQFALVVTRNLLWPTGVGEMFATVGLSSFALIFVSVYFASMIHNAYVLLFDCRMWKLALYLTLTQHRLLYIKSCVRMFTAGTFQIPLKKRRFSYGIRTMIQFTFQFCSLAPDLASGYQSEVFLTQTG